MFCDPPRQQPLIYLTTKIGMQNYIYSIALRTIHYVIAMYYSPLNTYMFI